MFRPEFLERVPQTALAIKKSVIMPIIAPGRGIVTHIPLIWVEIAQHEVGSVDPTTQEWDTHTEWFFDLDGVFYLLCALSRSDRLPITFSVKFPLPTERYLLEQCVSAEMISVLARPIPTWVENLRPDSVVEVTTPFFDTLRQGIGLMLPRSPFAPRGLARMLSVWQRSHDRLN